MSPWLVACSACEMAVWLGPSRRRMVALRAVDYKRKKELKEKNLRLRMSHSRVLQVVNSRARWRAKALARNVVSGSEAERGSQTGQTASTSTGSTRKGRESQSKATTATTQEKGEGTGHAHSSPG